jgi:hypothetical protein
MNHSLLHPLHAMSFHVMFVARSILPSVFLRVIRSLTVIIDHICVKCAANVSSGHTNWEITWKYTVRKRSTNVIYVVLHSYSHPTSPYTEGGIWVITGSGVKYVTKVFTQMLNCRDTQTYTTVEMSMYAMSVADHTQPNTSSGSIN